MTPRHASCLALLMLLAGASRPADGAGRLEDLIRKNAHTLEMSEGTLAGGGMNLLMKAAEGAQFFLIGEVHNVREIPGITTLLFRALHDRYGFEYLGLELGAVPGRMLSAPSRVGHRAAVIDLARRYPNSFQFITDQELEMIVSIGSIARGRGHRIWGLDQAFGALDILDRLLELAPGAEARAATRRLIATARGYERERFARNIHYMGDVPKSKDFEFLPALFGPAPGPEAAFLIDQLLLSDRIYEPYYWKGTKRPPGAFYDSGRAREDNMKDLFMAEYRRARESGDRMPKVLLKLGHYHLFRGMYRADVQTLGNFVSEFARSNDMGSFHLAMFVHGEAGRWNAIADVPSMAPLAAASDPGVWTLIDFRPLRGPVHDGQVEPIDPDLAKWIFGFDAALLIGGGAPGTYALTETPRFRDYPDDP